MSVYPLEDTISAEVRAGLRAHILNEKKRPYRRSLREYQFYLDGIASTLRYVRRHPELGNRVLDLGAGTTLAASQLQKSELGRGLNVWATVLVPHQEIELNLGWRTTRVAIAEHLKPFPDNYFSAVLNAYGGLSYSCRSEIAVLEVDRVLVPGGVLKSTADTGDILSILREIGYDIGHATMSTSFLAIKPTGFTRAEKLAERDSYYNYPVTTG